MRHSKLCLYILHPIKILCHFNFLAFPQGRNKMCKRYRDSEAEWFESLLKHLHCWSHLIWQFRGGGCCGNLHPCQGLGMSYIEEYTWPRSKCIYDYTKLIKMHSITIYFRYNPTHQRVKDPALLIQEQHTQCNEYIGDGTSDGGSSMIICNVYRDADQLEYLKHAFPTPHIVTHNVLKKIRRT